MLVYVAGASRELERAEAFIASLRLRGHEVTHDWTVDVRASRVAGVVDEQLSDQDAQRYAETELDAVVQAQLLVLLAPEQSTSGAWVEYGVAIAAGLPILVVGPRARCSIFTRLASGLCATDADGLHAVEVLERLGMQRAADWRCGVCGCTESTPCEGGCAWVAPNLCDRCARSEGEPPLIVRP